MVSISVIAGDIIHRPCDLLILKHADGFYGVDQVVAERVGFSGTLSPGRYSVVPGSGLEAREVLFIGVGPLTQFRYAQIRDFGRRALDIATKVGAESRKICSPIHGPGYGLDENEAFLSLVAGFVDGIDGRTTPSALQEIEIVERNKKRASRFSELLREGLSQRVERRSPAREGASGYSTKIQLDPSSHEELSSYGQESDKKTRLFVAMPFKEDVGDEWEIGITEAARGSNLICERIDEQAYIGDILSQIKGRIESYDGMIALLNGANPNVFLEIGFAWACRKPTILVAKEGQELPFDIRGQKCLFYKRISDLRTNLTQELLRLQAEGVFSGRRRT